MSHSGAVISTYYYLRDAQGNEMCRYVKYTNTTSQLMYVAQEHSIYGSSRVGVDNRKDTLYLGAVYTPTWGGVGASRRELGLKSFELANHLGNVLVTVSDKPVYKVSSGTIYFSPEISSISDYYPFGAPIQGRSFSSTEYRFGFNTQEKTDEITGPGNHNTATFWEYDTRLGRRWNTDPVVKPWESLYACLSDNPIFYTDPKGDFRTKFGAQVYKFFHGGTGKVSKANYGIHKGEWSVSQKVHRDGGAEGGETENRIGEVLIVQQGKWEWGKNNAESGGQPPLAKYVGDQVKYPGAIILETSLMSGGAVTLPPFVFTAPGRGKNEDLMRHEYGHILQYGGLSFLSGSLITGYGLYLTGIGVPSVFSAYKANTDPNYRHQESYTEQTANQLNYWFQGMPTNWNHTKYPVYYK